MLQSLHYATTIYLLFMQNSSCFINIYLHIFYQKPQNLSTSCFHRSICVPHKFYSNSIYFDTLLLCSWQAFNFIYLRIFYYNKLHILNIRKLKYLYIILYKHDAIVRNSPSMAMSLT